MAGPAVAADVAPPGDVLSSAVLEPTDIASDIVGSIVDESYLVAWSGSGEPFLANTALLPGTALRAWWFDPRTGTTIHAGSVARGDSVPFHPPQTTDALTAAPWFLIVEPAP